MRFVGRSARRYGDEPSTVATEALRDANGFEPNANLAPEPTGNDGRLSTSRVHFEVLTIAVVVFAPSMPVVLLKGREQLFYACLFVDCVVWKPHISQVGARTRPFGSSRQASH